MLEFKGKGLFVFSDPGAAKAVLAQALFLKNVLTEFQIISDRQYSFFTDFDLPVTLSRDTAEEVIRKMKPDFIFTGTSYTSKIELIYLKAAKKEGIQTFSFVDHWTSIKKRFDFNGEYIFPDTVLVIDKRAKKLAIEDEIEKSKITIFGNPYYAYLEKWRPTISKAELFLSLEITNTNSKLIVFAPDPLSNVNGVETYGFDELTATKKISDILDSNSFGFTFVLKVHPNQNLEKLKFVLGNKIVIAQSNVDSNILIFYADAIIGFFSNFLIEADIMHKKVLRYHPAIIKNDPFAELGVGKKISDAQLIEELTMLDDAGK